MVTIWQVAAHSRVMTDESLSLNITSPAELVALIPYWLGYQPQDALVVLAAHGGRVELGCALNADQFDDDETLDDLAGVLRQRVGDAQLIVVGFGKPEPIDEAVARMEIALGAERLDSSMVVSGRRFWLRSAGERPLWSAGHEFDPRSSVAATTAVSAGLQILGSREDVAALVSGRRATTPAVARAWRAASIELAGWSATRRYRALDQLLARVIGEKAQLSTGEYVELGVLAQDLGLRDRAWLSMDSQRAWSHEQLWLAVIDVTPRRYAPPVLCLAGVAAWLSGGGAVFTECLARCEQIDPDYSMAALLREIHDRAVPPSLWKRMGASRESRERRCAEAEAGDRSEEASGR